MSDALVSDPQISVSSVSPAPTDDELVAIVAALELAWPRPVVVAAVAAPSTSSWRFSGRWWAKSPLPAASRTRP